MTIELRSNQSRGRDIMQAVARYGFEHDCGTGKTIMALAGIRAFGKGKWVVVCPLSVIETAWMRDAKQMGFPSVWSLAGLPMGERVRMIEKTPAGVLVINFDIYARHVEDFIKNGWRKLIVDEASRMKNHKAVQCQAILRHAEKCERFYWLSGTPAPNGEHEYWAVLRATRPDLVPASPFQFWSRYFTPTYRRIRVKGGGERKVVDCWEIRNDRRQHFEDLLSSSTWVLRKEDCVDLPPQQDLIRDVRLSEAERRAYDEAQAELKMLVKKAGSLRLVRLKAQSLVHKLRQMAGGWAYHGEDVTEYGSAKIDECSGLLEELGRKPVLIWVDFRHDAERVRKMLESMGRTHKMLIGGGDDVKSSVAAFQDGSLDVLVCHPQSVGHGVTMTRASDAIYYTLPWSWEYYKQSRDRIHRYTQTSACSYHLLMSKDTIDSAVLDVLTNKKDRHDELAAVLAELGMETGDDDSGEGGGREVPVGAVRAE
jgi:SNF2 family DNA or RNA helicase